MTSYEVDLNQFAKPGALSISAVRLANGLRPDDANIIPLFTTEFQGNEYTLIIEKFNPISIETTIPKSDADIDADEFAMKTATGFNVNSSFEYDAMFYWTLNNMGVGNYIPEISLNPEDEIMRLKIAISNGTIS